MSSAGRPFAVQIETERLILRAHGLGDFSDMCGLWGDPEVTRHILPQPSTRAEVWARLLRYAGAWSLLGYGFWIIRDKKSNAFIGEIGFLNAQRDIEPAIGDRPEFGYALAPAVQGKGFALEAASAALDWGDRNLRSRECVCLIDAGNAPSLRLAEKLGFAETARLQYAGTPNLLLCRQARTAYSPDRNQHRHSGG